MEEEILMLIDGVPSTTILSEPVYGGSRPLIKHYDVGFIVVETIEYYEPASSEGWSNVKTKTYGIQ